MWEREAPCPTGLALLGPLSCFLAPSGAQEVTLSVRLSIRPSGSGLSRALNLHLSGPGLS